MLREDLDRIDTVPMLPAVVGRIISMVEDPSVNAYDVSGIVSKDQSLVSSILRIINSAHYGFFSRITSINQAVVLLGFRTIRNLALAATVMTVYGGSSKEKSFDRAEHWKHSMATALATDLVAKQWRKKLVPDAYLVGLVHDIGRVIMDQHFPEEFDQACALGDLGSASLVDNELQVFGLSHADIGGHVARKWNFPADIVTSILNHHGPPPNETWTPMAALVHIADACVHEIGIPQTNKQIDLSPEALELLGTDECGYQEMVEHISETFNQTDIFEGLVA